MKNLLLIGITVLFFSCSTEKYVVDKNFLSDKTSILIIGNGKTIKIVESEQFLENDSLLVSFKNLPMDFSLKRSKEGKLEPKFYYWFEGGDLARREYVIGFEKLKLTLNNENPKIGEYIQGKIKALTLPIPLDGKVTQFQIEGQFKHQIIAKK